MLDVWRSRYYAPDRTGKAENDISNYEMCIWAKLCCSTQQWPPLPLEQIYDRRDGPEDVMEIDHLREVPASNGYRHTLTSWDTFSRYLFSVPLQQPRTRAALVHFHGFLPSMHLYQNIYWLTKDLQLLLKCWQNSWTKLALRSPKLPSSKGKPLKWSKIIIKNFNKSWRLL